MTTPEQPPSACILLTYFSYPPSQHKTNNLISSYLSVATNKEERQHGNRNFVKVSSIVLFDAELWSSFHVYDKMTGSWTKCMKKISSYSGRIFAQSKVHHIFEIGKQVPRVMKMQGVLSRAVEL